MASVVIAGDTSGTVTLAAPAVAGTTTLTLPTANGTVITTGSSGQSIPKAALPTGSVLQVVSTTKTDTFSTTSSSYVDVTGLSVSITPTSATSKILITGLVNFAASADTGFFRLVRDSTAICVGDAAGIRVQATAQQRNSPDSADADAASVNFLDSPNTTSSVTYKIQLASPTPSGSYTTRVNSAADDANQANRARTASTITVMEIAA